MIEGHFRFGRGEEVKHEFDILFGSKKICYLAYFMMSNYKPLLADMKSWVVNILKTKGLSAQMRT